VKIKIVLETKKKLFPFGIIYSILEILADLFHRNRNQNGPSQSSYIGLVCVNLTKAAKSILIKTQDGSFLKFTIYLRVLYYLGNQHTKKFIIIIYTYMYSPRATVYRVKRATLVSLILRIRVYTVYTHTINIIL